MAREKEVRVKIKALDRISKTLERVRSKFPKLDRAVKKTSRNFQLFAAKTKGFRTAMRKAGKSMQSVGRTMTAAVSLPIGLAGAAIIRTGVNFQKSINKVGAVTKTIMGGKVTPQFEALEKQALMLGKTTEFSSTQAADAMALMGRAGFNAEEILASTSDVLALASASGMDLAFTADVMSKTIRQFGFDAKEATRVSDVLAEVSRSTNVDLETIAETFKDAAPLAAQYGATLEQTAALTGLLGDIGIQGSKAGTTLKNIFLKIAAPTATATKLLKAMGISTTEANGEMKSAGKILTELGPKLGGLNKGNQLAIMNELFGLRGIAGATALMSKAFREGKDPVATLTGLLLKSKGAAKDMQAVMLRGAPGAMARFESALEGLGLAFAKSGLLGAFTSVLETTTKWMSALSNVHPVILTIITVIAGLTALIGPLLLGLGAMAVMIAQLIFFAGALDVALLPILITVGLVAIAIAAAVVGIGILIWTVDRLIDRWDTMVQAFKDSKGFFSGIGNFFKTFAVDDVTPGFLNSMKGPFPGLHDATVDQGNNVFSQEADKNKEAGMFGPAFGAAKSIAGVGGSTNTNNANVKVDFSNVPTGTKVKSTADNSNLFGLNVGFTGGIQ